ncbi:bifunctional DNA primase/polymerase [Candidatus Pacearchaeota archaeon]|nr:bifunctional DNA primase/polymerase [Candidatus Pacearchaeota archaeon]
MSLQDAIEYGEFGWAVFPLLPRSKAPATPNGFHDASKDENAIRAMWGARTNLNLGIATGEVSGFWVLDIDSDKGGNEALEELENKYGSLPETLISNTGGGGKHYLFKIPKGTKMGCSTSKIAKGIDVRGDGGYIAAPPSTHPTGDRYIWATATGSDVPGDISEAPAWLIKIISELKKVSTKVETVEEATGDWTTDDVLDMLAVISPDERDVWITVGMALSEAGWPVTMWDTWSRDSSKYKMGEPFRIWAGFKKGGGVSMGSLVHLAQEHGWEPKERPYEELDFSNIGGVDLQAFKDKLSPPEQPEPELKINIGGLVGDTLTWINSTAFKLQPELTIMNVLASLGAVFGRRYALQKLNTRTNIYMVGIAETGQGKDNSRQKIKQLLKLAQLEQFSGPDDVRSGAGLLLELKQRPSILVNMDEIGMFMKALLDAKAPAYMKEVSKLIALLYSSSGSSYTGGLLASQPTERTTLYEPNLCIYGTTTMDSYSEAMRSAAIKSGELNRFIVLKSSTDFPEPNFESDNSEPPEALISRWALFKTEGLEAAPDIIEQKKTIVMLGKMGKKVNDLFRFQDSMIKKHRATGLGALWVRYRENILKIAMIIAIARDSESPTLIESDLEFGEALVGASIRFMMKFATENMYDSDFQKRCSEFMVFLESGATDRTKMIRRLKIKSKELDEIERTLKEMDKITYDERDRPRKYILR